MWQREIFLTLILLSTSALEAFSSIVCDDPRFRNETKSTRETKRMPRMDAGSFESLATENNSSTRDVLIYWITIADSDKCESSHEYHVYYDISVKPGGNVTATVRSNETYNNYAKFRGLSANTGYNFTVYSTDEDGLSTQPSTIYVPSESEKNLVKLSLTKTVLDDRGGFELSWRNDDDRKLTSSASANRPSYYDYYTIFWCERNNERSNRCKGNMNRTHVSGLESSYNVTVADCAKKYRFAISANSQIISSGNDSKEVTIDDFHPCCSSTGIVWESCTVLKNVDNDTENYDVKIENVWIGFVSSTFFKLQWYVDCSEKMIDVQGYRVMYCPVVSKNDTGCTEPMTNKTILPEIERNRSMSFSFIRNLTPYTTYKIIIALITNRGEGLPSEPIIESTHESAPVVTDIHVTVTNVTRSSFDVDWSYPKYSNGVIRYYLVQYCVQENEYSTTDEDPTFAAEDIGRQPFDVIVRENKCRIENLEMNSNYTITVIACTTQCSDPSPPVFVQTKRYVDSSVALDIQDLRVSVSNVTNTSLVVRVTTSPLMYSVLQYYRIQYFLIDDVLPIEHHRGAVNSSGERVFNFSAENDKFQLDNLESFSNYSIVIVACAPTECSVPTLPVLVQTAIGRPGKIALFDLQYESDTSILVPWSRPVRPGGPVNYYQLVGAHYKGPTRLPTTYTRRFTPRDIFAAELMENPDRFFFTTNFTEIVVSNIPVPRCKEYADNGHTYTTIYVSVRAVNENPLNPDAEPFYGPWSDTRLTTTRCLVGFVDYDH